MQSGSWGYEKLFGGFFHRKKGGKQCSMCFLPNTFPRHKICKFSCIHIRRSLTDPTVLISLCGQLHKSHTSSVHNILQSHFLHSSLVPMWDLWQTNWHWDRILSEYFSVPLSSFHQSSMLILQSSITNSQLKLC